MHSIGIYDTGCTYGSACKKKHERPSIEPPENDVVTAAGNAKPVSSMATGATRVSTMATGASPEANGGECVLKSLPASEIKSQDFVLVPNKTNYWMKNNNVWLQAWPENENETLCQNCDDGQSHIAPCSDGGQHLLLSQQIASALASSSKDPENPLQWASYASQMKAAQDVQANSVLTTGTRVGSPPIFVVDRRSRKMGCFSVRAKACMPGEHENMHSCLYDSD